MAVTDPAAGANGISAFVLEDGDGKEVTAMCPCCGDCTCDCSCCDVECC